MGKAEAVVENYLVAEVKKRHGIAYKFTSPARRNVPDRLCVFPGGMVMFVECKAEGGKLTKGQLKEIERLTELSQPAAVVFSKADVTELMKSVDLAAKQREQGSCLVDRYGRTYGH